MRTDVNARVLTFYPHARGFAYALFEGDRPVDWGISDLRGERLSQPLIQRLSRLLDHGDPDVVVLRKVKSATAYRRSAALQEAMCDLARTKGISSLAISRKQIREAFSDLGTPTRQAIAEAIVETVPLFAAFLPPRRKIWNGEDRRMALFDALALIFAYRATLNAGSSISSILEA